MAEKGFKLILNAIIKAYIRGLSDCILSAEISAFKIILAKLQAERR